MSCRGQPCGARGFNGGLLKDTYNLGLKLRKFHGEHAAAGMKDEIGAGWQQVDMTAKRFSYATLNAVALVGFAEHFAHREADSRGR